MRISRRGFLGACGLTMIGCDMKKNGQGAPPARRPEAVEAPPPGNAGADTGKVAAGAAGSAAASWAFYQVKPNRAASPLVAAPGVLARLEAGALALYETGRFSVTARIALTRPFGVGVLGDGSVLALAEHDGQPAVFHVPRGAKDARRYGSAIARGDGRARVFPGAEAGRFVVVAPSSRYRLFEYRFADDRVRAVGSGDELSPADHETMMPWQGGVLFQRWASLVAAKVNAAPVLYPAGSLSASHLAPGPAGRIWASEGDAIRLLELADPIADRARLDAGGLVYHLDGDAAGAAAVVVKETSPTERQWWVRAWDAAGRELWRADLPVLEPPDAMSRFARVTDAAVVIEDAAGIHVFARADGKRLGSP